MTLPTGQILNNRYRIVRTLGEGGMGRVYRAWDLNLKRPCAIKENLDLSDDSTNQFEHEALILAGLHHPNLPRVIDHFQLPNQGQYLVMDYVEGDDLQLKLAALPGYLPEADVVGWMLQICDALTYLHNHKPPVIHRDIKPANIKIDPEGKAILVDFGIAKLFTAGAKTTKGARAATPGYAPPEQFGIGTTDERSDIYALGATTYTLLTGLTPPAAMDIVSGNVPAPLAATLVNPQVASQVSAAIEQAMQINRSARFASAAEFASALRSTAPVDSPAKPDWPIDPAQAISASLAAAQQASGSGAIPPVVSVAPSLAKPPPTAQPAVKPGRAPLWILLGVVIALLAVGGVFFGNQIINPQPTPVPTKPLVAEVNPPTRLPTVAPVPTKKPAVTPAPTKPPVATPTSLPAEVSGICASGKSYKLTLWNGYDDNYDASHLNAYQAYMQRNPCVTIETRYSNDLEKDLLSAAKSGQSPDLIGWANDHIGSLASNKLIIDLDRFSIGPYYLANRYIPVAAQGVTLNGKVYGLPETVESIALVYNRDLNLQKYLPIDPMNMPALLEKARQFKDERGFPLFCNQAFSSADAYHVAPVFFGFGVPEYVDQSGNAFMDTPQALQAAEWIMQLRPLTFPEANHEYCQQAFLEGKTGMWWTGPWAIGSMLESNKNIGILPMGRPFVGIRTLFITGEAVQRGNAEAALDLMKYLTSADVQAKLAMNNRTIPAQVEAFQIPAVKNDPIIAGFAEAASLGVPMGNHVFTGAQWGPVGDAVLDLWNGKLTPKQAMLRAQKQIEEQVAQIKNQ